MKILLIVFLLIFNSELNFAITNEANYKASLITKNANICIRNEHIQKGRKTKDGRYKRKKGFMWGLFGKKKECDCPKN